MKKKKTVTKKSTKKGRPKKPVTQEIVKKAMKIVSNEVQKPKVVRKGKIKPKSSKLKNIKSLDEIEDKGLVKELSESKQFQDNFRKEINKPIPSGISCVVCEEDIPQQRLDYFKKQGKTTTKCTKCSDVKTKKPIVLTQGSGEDIYQETYIVDDETYQKHRKVEEETNRLLFGKSPNRNVFDEENNNPKPNTTNLPE